MMDWPDAIVCCCICFCALLAFSLKGAQKYKERELSLKEREMSLKEIQFKVDNPTLPKEEFDAQS